MLTPAIPEIQDDEQQQSQSDIVIPPFGFHGTSSAVNLQNPARRSTPFIVPPEQTMASNIITAPCRYRYRPLPSPNQDANNHIKDETTMTGLGSLPAGSEEQYTLGRWPYYVNHNLNVITRADPRRQSVIHVMGWNAMHTSLLFLPKLLQEAQPQTTSQLGPLPPGWDMRHTPTGRVCFFNHNIRMSTWDDPRLLSLNANASYEHYFHRKLICFYSQLAMRARPGNCQIKVRRNHIFEDSYTEIMRQSPIDLKRRLKIKFEGEDGSDYGGLARFVPKSTRT